MKARAVLIGLAAAALLGLGICSLGLGSIALAPPPAAAPASTDTGLSDFAKQDIPAVALAAYQAGAKLCPGLSWTVLAGIGKVESNHGRSILPGVHSGQNSAGAMGPMQFLAATWAAFGAGGNIDDIVAAAAGAARYLCSNGAGDPAKLRDAIWHYNHAWWYVAQVLDLAARYAAAPTTGGGIGLGQAGSPFQGCASPVVSQPYGPTNLVGEPIINGVRFHTGIDLACPLGTRVVSRIQGTAHLILSGTGFGNSVVVDSVFEIPGLPRAHYFVRYAHLLLPLVLDGASVSPGQVIGLEGSTGFSTGPHLHFEVDRDQLGVCCSVSPQSLL